MFRPALILLMALWASAAPGQHFRQDLEPPHGVSEGKLLNFQRLQAIARRAAGGGSMIGSEFDSSEQIYQFKFIKDGVVTLIYVDARPGRVVGVEGG